MSAYTVSAYTASCPPCGSPDGPYSADSAGVVLFDVGPQRFVAGLRPGAQRRLALVGLRRAGLLPQVVELEGHLVVGVEEASISQVAVLCDQNLRRVGGQWVCP